MPDVVLYAIAYIIGYLISVRLVSRIQYNWCRRVGVKWDSDDDLWCAAYSLVWPVTLPVVALLSLPEAISNRFPRQKNHRPLAKLTGVKDER